MRYDSHHLVSSHNTLLYFDYAAGKIRHAPFGTAPLNLRMEIDGEWGRLIAVAPGAEHEPNQLSFVSPADPIRVHAGRARADCLVEGIVNDRISIYTRDHYLSADPNGLVHNDRTWCREWEQFVPVAASTLDLLILLHQHSWLSRDDDQVISLVGGFVDFHDIFAIGPARVRLSGSGAAFFTDTSNSDELRIPTQIKLLDVERAVHVFSRLPTVRSFDLFDTLLARRCVTPYGILEAVERASGRRNFAKSRTEAETEVAEGDYSLDDVYRRLVANTGITEDEARTLKELELAVEAENIFPIAQHCSELQATDVIVSDMYLEKSQLIRLLERNNVRSRNLYVTTHGKRSGSIWPAVSKAVRIVEHVGDNELTDVQSAHAAGITARLTTIARRTSIEQELADQGFVPLSNLIREARLTTWSADAKTRQAELAQIQFNFPLLFLATLHLHKLSIVHGWERILMSARDCYLWHRLYHVVRSILPKACPATYFYSSRVARAFPSAEYLAYFAHLRAGRRSVVTDLTGTGWSLTHLVGRSPEPPTDIFILRKIEDPNCLRRYEDYARLTKPLNFISPISEGNHSVLEYLNRSQDPQLMDIGRSTDDEFYPLFSPLEYGLEAKALIGVHHRAFDHASSLVRQLSSSVGEMLALDLVPSMTALSRGMTMGIELRPLIEHEEREEQRLWPTMNEAAARSRGTA